MIFRGFCSSIVTGIAVASLLCLLAAPALAASDGSFERTLQVTGPINLDLTTGSGNVTIRTGSSSQVQVTGRIKVTNWFGGDASEPSQTY